MAKKIVIKQVRSKISAKPKQVKTLWSLGLRKVNSERIHEDNPVTRGMINSVKHLVEVKEINE